MEQHHSAPAKAHANDTADSAPADDTPMDKVVWLFWHKGYPRASVRAAGEASGLGIGGIYQRYGSKEGLLDAALTHYEGMIERELIAPLEASEKGLPALERFFDGLGQWICCDGRRGCMLINMLATGGEASQCAKPHCRDLSLRLRKAIGAALERAWGSGEMRGNDREARTDLLMGVVMGLNIAARGGASDDELHRLLAGVRAQLRLWRLL